MHDPDVKAVERWASRLCVLVALAGIGARPSAAQIRGQVVDASNGTGVAAARITLLDAENDSLATAVADEGGQFQVLWSGEPGSYVLRVQALGYQGVTDPIQYGVNPVLVEVRVTPAPVELDGLEVSVKALSPYLARSGFYDRQRYGTGEFFDSTSFPPNAVSRTARLMERTSGLRLHRGREPFFTRTQGLRPGDQGLRCYPVVVIDGATVRLARNTRHPMWVPFEDVVPLPANVLAIEVYRSTATAPARWKSLENECGVVAIWTKR